MSDDRQKIGGTTNMTPPKKEEITVRKQSTQAIDRLQLLHWEDSEQPCDHVLADEYGDLLFVCETGDHNDPDATIGRWQASEIPRGIDVLCVPVGAVRETRALDTTRGLVSGYYKDPAALAKGVLYCTCVLRARGVYFTANPCQPELLNRAINRLREYCKKDTTADNNIERRCWLILDFDPVRASGTTGIPSTKEEHHRAFVKAEEVREHLARQGFPDPIVIDSGNGAYLLYRIDLPIDKESTELVKAVLEALDLFFSDETISIDRTMYNAARIIRLPGTMNRKGDSSPERPHRYARLVEVPPEIEVTSREALERIATMLPKPPSGAQSSTRPNGVQFDLDTFIQQHGIAVKHEKTWNGGRLLVLDHCVFDSTHGGTSVAIIQHVNGALAYKCQHNGCADCKWQDVRDLFEPGYQQRREAYRQRQNGSSAQQEQNGSSTQDEEKAWTTPFSEIEAEDVEWAWEQHIAIGKLNLLAGDPGLGKSFVTLDIAARVSTGTAFPDGTPCTRGTVLLVGDEDGAGDTVRRRLDAQGADVTRIHRLAIRTKNSEVQLSLEEHLPQIREKLRELGDVRLLVIDPLTAYMGETDSNKDGRVRGLLTPFAAMAAEMRVAVLGIMHLNKAAVLDIIYRVTGSVAFIAQARVAWIVAPDPDNPVRRLFLKLKNNLARADLPGLAFVIGENEQGHARLEWNPEPVTTDISKVVGGFSNSRQPRGPKPDKLEAAKTLITEALADGGWHPSDPIIEAGKQQSISEGTMFKAAKTLGVSKTRKGFAGDGGWRWALNASPLGNSESLVKPFSPNGFTKDLLHEKTLNLWTKQGNSESLDENSKSLKERRNCSPEDTPLAPQNNSESLSLKPHRFTVSEGNSESMAKLNSPNSLDDSERVQNPKDLELFGTSDFLADTPALAARQDLGEPTQTTKTDSTNDESGDGTDEDF